MKNKRGQYKDLSRDEVEETLARLEGIAGQFRRNGPEEKAIRVAAEALLYVQSRRIGEKFLDFMLSSNRVLTPAQLAHLRAMGIDPDSPEPSETNASRPRGRLKTSNARAKKSTKDKS
ncbi:MAG TPA: hypothetical protein VFC78_00110 [Tepidisphaeraceae bacterium]|nr:hypothetical protein [Tepidisphaeraceae bacterium]